jgi:hypothetical protein
MTVSEMPIGSFQPQGLKVEFAYWAKMARWTANEAAAILVGLDPHFAIPRLIENAKKLLPRAGNWIRVGG